MCFLFAFSISIEKAVFLVEGSGPEREHCLVIRVFHQQSRGRLRKNTKVGGACPGSREFEAVNTCRNSPVEFRAGNREKNPARIFVLRSYLTVFHANSEVLDAPIPRLWTKERRI
jgi:hypothetical protein